MEDILDDALGDHNQSLPTFVERIQDDGKGSKECPNHGDDDPSLEGRNIVDCRGTKEGQWDEDDEDDRLKQTKCVRKIIIYTR